MEPPWIAIEIFAGDAARSAQKVRDLAVLLLTVWMRTVPRSRSPAEALTLLWGISSAAATG